jgi:hypothetical protein
MKEKPKVPHINARAETVHKLPLFREAFAKRRCLIPATGFYEWQQRSDGNRDMGVRALEQVKRSYPPQWLSVSPILWWAAFTTGCLWIVAGGLRCLAGAARFGPKPLLTAEVVKKIKELRKDGLTVPEIMRRMKLSKASIYRALA